MPQKIVMPSEVTPGLSKFDRFSRAVADQVSKSWFFSFCLVTIVIWLPSYFFIKNVNTYELIINTWTTLVTYLLVSLLSNTQTRDSNALQHKTNSIADALADIADALETILDDEEEKENLRKDITELRAAVGIEQHESS